MEERLAEPLRGRIGYHATRYHEAHDSEGRGWITFDGREIANFCTLGSWNREHVFAWDESLGDEIDSRAARLAEGFYTLEEYQGLLHGYLNTSIEDALKSDIVLERAIAMFDRRLGRRRLRGIRHVPTSHPLVKKFYEIRCATENIQSARSNIEIIRESETGPLPRRR